MGRRPGDRVAGRWVIRAEAPGSADLRRWHVEDPATGEAAEVLEPSAAARVRPGALDGFRASAAGTGAPAGLARVLVETPEGPVAVGPPTRGTLADVPALAPDVALALARRLGPALVPAAAGGRLAPEDLVVDGEGRVRVARTGIPGSGGHLDVPRFTAPEVAAGARPTDGAALFGLGVLLYHRVTGAWPWQASSAVAWREALARGAPPAPSTLRPGVPPEVDALLTGLLSPDPGRRVAAVGALGPAEGDPPRIEVPERAAPRVGAVPATGSGAELPAPRVPASGGHVVVADLAGAPAPVLSLVSAITGLDPTSLQAAGKRGVVVGRARDAASAAAIAGRLEACGLACRAIPAPFPAALVLGGVSSLAFMAAGALLLVSRLAALAVAAVGVVLGVAAASRPRAPLASASHARPHPVPAVAAVERRIVRLLARLPDLGLPSPALHDLRDDLHALVVRARALGGAGSEADLAEVAGLVADAEAALPEGGAPPDPVDAAALRRRLDAVRAARSEVEAPPRPRQPTANRD